MDHGSVDERCVYVCHTNLIGSTIKHQSNFLFSVIIFNETSEETTINFVNEQK